MGITRVERGPVSRVDLGSGADVEPAKGIEPRTHYATPTASPVCPDIQHQNARNALFAEASTAAVEVGRV